MRTMQAMDRPGPAPDRASPARSRLPLALLATVGALLLAEGLVRWLHLGPGVYGLATRWFRLSALPGVEYEFRPLVPYGREFINADSMRDRPRQVEKAPGVYRVACVGDSICVGLGISATQCFSRVWENALQEEGVAAEVLNFGVPGYNLRHILAALRARTMKYRPDMVVYAYCLNDVQEDSFELEELKDRLSPAQRDFWERSKQRGASWLARSRLYNLARYGLAARFGRPGPPRHTRPEDDPQFVAIFGGRAGPYFQSLYDDAGRARLRTGLQEFGNSVREEGALPVLAVFPLPDRIAGSALDPVYELVVSAAREADLRVVDLRGDFAQNGINRLFGDPLHPNAPGHEVAAGALARELDVFVRGGR